MRDPKRIGLFLEKIGEYWEKVPDWRFGQLISNFASWLGRRDIFFIEEDEFLELMDKYFSNHR
jgi:hypothetical protein